MRKKKLFLHIGSHKTGTTRIQTGLMNLKPRLAEHGFSFAYLAPNAHLHEVLLNASPDGFLPRGMHVADELKLRQAFEDCDGDVVTASAENFSFFFDKASIEALARLLDPLFAEVQIVVYLRRQDLHIVSHHQEGAKPGRSAENELFGHQPTALPKLSTTLDLYLDYEHRIGMWLDVFGEKNVSVQVFDRKLLKDGDALADFLRVIGLDLPKLIAPAEINTSAGMSRTKIGHMMNRQGMRYETRQRLLDKMPDDPPMVPARRDAEALYDRYRQGNIRLAERLGHPAGTDLFSDDFSKYPDEGKEDWDPQTARMVIETLIDELSRFDAAAYTENLRDAAILAHRAGRKQLACDLMRGALAQRPHAPFLQSKLAEFEATLQGSGAESEKEPT